MIPLQGKSKIISKDEKLPVIRRGAIVYNEYGKPVPNTTEEFTIVCNVQPLNGKDLLLVAEGDRLKEQFWVWSDNFPGCKKPQPNDMVTRCGINFQVQSAEDWGSYTRSRIMRIDVGPDRTPGEQAIS